MREFHLGDILTITTDRLVSPDGIAGAYNILNYMLDDNLFTHQLPRASEECKPFLLQQYPHLAEIVVPDKFENEADVWKWLNTQVAKYGERLPVRQVPEPNHQNPIEELSDMVGPERILVVGVDDEPTEN
jgi:hypothetical protein